MSAAAIAHRRRRHHEAARAGMHLVNPVASALAVLIVFDALIDDDADAFCEVRVPADIITRSREASR
jgi:hypothetical protein